MPMVENQEEEKRKKEIEILSRAFASFNEATQQLQNSYDNLQQRVQALDLELAQKNEELQRNLKEKDEVKNYLNYILESLTTGVIMVNEKGMITTFNKALGEITGEHPDICLGKTPREAFGSDLIENMVHQLTQSDPSLPCVDGEMTTRRGGRINIRVSANPVMDNMGKQIGTVIVVQDTTQLKRLEDEVQRNQRLRAMGEMAAGIAHEIRNPLGSIELFASLLKNDLKNDEEKRQLAERICAGVHNMDRIISNVLLFAKSPQPSRQKCDINRLLAELLEFSPGLVLPENIQVVREFGVEEMIGNADGELLKPVFLNLVRNALQAMPKGGVLRVATRQSAEPQAPGLLNMDHRNFITVTVADTGVGIPKEQLPKIFNPFFTTKERGTGLGLAIAHSIVKAHQGILDVESAEGKGSAFTVKIPCWDANFDEG